MTETNRKRPNLVFIAPFSPWPSLSGGALRTALFAEAAAKVGHVRMISLYSHHSLQGPDHIEEIVVRPDSASRLWSLCDVMNPLAPRLPPALTWRANRLVEEFDPDIIFFEQTITTGLFEHLESKTAMRVLNSHNFDTDLLRDILAQSDGGTLKTVSQMRLDQALVQETAVSRNCDAVICCSKLDAQKFKELAGVRCSTVPNPVPDERAFDLEISHERYVDADIIYVGSMDYAPNLYAARILISNLPPILPDDIRLILAGRKASNLAVHASGISNIHIVSDPADLTPLLGTAGFSLMPIRQGGGTRLKVLEAMAAGLVLIATEKAVEGLELVAGQHYVRAESDDELRQAYLEWSKSPDQCRKLALRARQFVQEHFSQTSFERSVHNAIAEVLLLQESRTSRHPISEPDNRHTLPPSRSPNGPDTRLDLGTTAITGQHQKSRKIEVEPFLVGTFHKTGTTLFGGILNCLSKRHGLSIWNCKLTPEQPKAWDVAFNWHTTFAQDDIDPRQYPTVVVVRDPRDVIISSAHYHMKSSEDWLHIPREEFEGSTYQEEINHLKSMRERYLFEMDHAAAHTIAQMASRKSDPSYSAAKFVTLEALMTDVDMILFTDVFTHLGFKGPDLQAALGCAEINSVFAGKRNDHMRDPRAEQWREIFDSDLHAKFNSRFPDVTALLGYENF